MDVENNIPSGNTISKSESYPLYKDYNALLAQGYELIAKYSGSLWTNYNDSDPGITILQNLCYVLTELGNKTDLSIQDILTDENGTIAYTNHFHTSEEILPSNPVTFNDYSKALLNALPELKQVYINKINQPYGGGIAKVSLEIKPEYNDIIRKSASVSSTLRNRASAVLNQTTNLGQLFYTPLLLNPVLLSVSGVITISKSEIPEKVIADILFAGNNCLSPYPVYTSYQKLLLEGQRLTELLEGPYLQGGYIEDSAIVAKRTSLTKEELSAAWLNVMGIEAINLKALFKQHQEDASAIVCFTTIEAPYFSIEELLKTIQVLINGKDVTSLLNADKISYYLQQLIPLQQNCDLTKLLPTGEYRNISQYYSIQNAFPTIYQLSGKGSTVPTQQAKINQLKAYLVHLEQHIANYLAQLSNTAELFSFSSGRTNTRLTSTTYFTQPLYAVPGIEKVLKGVEGYRSVSTQAATSTDWKAYMADTDNPYLQRITSSSASAADDLSRKLKALEHLLARCGKVYDHQPLQFTNPYYGADAIAEIEYLKHTLQHLPVLSANRVRTYFKTEKHAPLVTGLELNLENELGLRAFYQGMIEVVYQSLATGQGLDIIYYENGKADILYPKGEEVVEDSDDYLKSGIVEVQWNERILFTFKPGHKPSEFKTASEVKHFLDPYLMTLAVLARPYYGGILIDCLRLASFLRFRWKLYATDHTILYESEELSFERLTLHISLILGDASPETIFTNSGKDIEIGFFKEEQWVYLCSGVATQEKAKQVIERIQEVRKSSERTVLVTEVLSEDSIITFPIEMLYGSLVLCLPEWVSLYQQVAYKELLSKKLLVLAPASTVCYTYFPSLTEFKKLLVNYTFWMEGLESLYAGSKANTSSKKAAFEILKSLLSWNKHAG